MVWHLIFIKKNSLWLHEWKQNNYVAESQSSYRNAGMCDPVSDRCTHTSTGNKMFSPQSSHSRKKQIEYHCLQNDLAYHYLLGQMSNEPFGLLMSWLYVCSATLPVLGQSCCRCIMWAEKTICLVKPSFWVSMEFACFCHHAPCAMAITSWAWAPFSEFWTSVVDVVKSASQFCKPVCNSIAQEGALVHPLCLAGWVSSFASMYSTIHITNPPKCSATWNDMKFPQIPGSFSDHEAHIEQDTWLFCGIHSQFCDLIGASNRKPTENMACFTKPIFFLISAHCYAWLALLVDPWRGNCRHTCLEK